MKKIESLSELFQLWLYAPKEKCCNSIQDIAASHYVDLTRNQERKPYSQLCRREQLWLEYCAVRDGKEIVRN
jgi:hypothetical protein